MCYCSARLRGSNAVTYASRVIVHATPEPNATGLTSLYVVASTLITVVHVARHVNLSSSDVPTSDESIALDGGIVAAYCSLLSCSVTNRTQGTSANYNDNVI